jgi:hypothetical protein
MVEGDALDQKGPELVELRQSSEGFVGVKVVIQDLEDLGGLGATQKVPFYTGGIDLTAFAAKHEEECGELMPDSQQVQCMIELVDKGFRSRLSVYSAFFPCRHFGMNLILKGLVSILNGLDLVQIQLIRLDLKLFHGGCENDKRLIVQIVQDNVNEGHHTILGLDEVDGDLLESPEPIGKGRGVLQGCAQEDQLNRGRDENKCLFPDLAAIRIIDEVALIKDDEAQVVKRQGSCKAETLCFTTLFVKKVPKNFGGHHENLGIGLELDIACHDTDSVFWELFLEIGELLIGEGFDRIGGKDSLAFRKGLVDVDLSDCGLP